MEFKTDAATDFALNGYQDAEFQFRQLLERADLDRDIARNPAVTETFEEALEGALADGLAAEPDPAALLFLHRTLYRINRLKLFWYDDLQHYANEDSAYLFALRKRIESGWQEWETDCSHSESLHAGAVRAALQKRVTEDLDPEPSATALYFRNEMTKAGYRRLLQIASLDGLVEASQLSRVLGGVGNEVQSMLTKIFLEEYGKGVLARKHSSFFTTMLNAFGMDARPEAYFDLVPWEVLANINHSFFLCEHKRNFLRYAGGLLYLEVSVPASFENYRLAGIRLGLGPEAVDYWDLHIKEDQRHGRWMLDDVALPLVQRYPQAAWQLVWGYEQQRFLSTRAGAAIARCAREADHA